MPEHKRVLINKSDYHSIDDFLINVREILGNEACNNPLNGKFEILNFEKENNIKLPQELRKYFEIVNGIEGAEWITNLYPLSEITHISKHFWFDENDTYKSEQYKNFYIIGDLMINSHQWAIKLDNKGDNEAIIEMDTETIITNNISDFLELFINESPYSLVR